MAADIPTTDTSRTGRQDPTDQKITQDYPESADWLTQDLPDSSSRPEGRLLPGNTSDLSCSALASEPSSTYTRFGTYPG